MNKHSSFLSPTSHLNFPYVYDRLFLSHPRRLGQHGAVFLCCSLPLGAFPLLPHQSSIGFSQSEVSLPWHMWPTPAAIPSGCPCLGVGDTRLQPLQKCPPLALKTPFQEHTSSHLHNSTSSMMNFQDHLLHIFNSIFLPLFLKYPCTRTPDRLQCWHPMGCLHPS